MPRGVTSISEVKSKLLSPAQTSHFLVDIPFPPGTVGERLRRLVGQDLDKLSLQCSEASLPGSTFATSVIDNDRTGVTERHAYRKIFDDRIDLTFYVDAEKYLPILFFEEWMNHIAGQDFGKSGDALIDPSQRIKDLRSANYNYRFRYPDDYIAEGFVITKIEKDFYREVRQSNILESIFNTFTGADLGRTSYKPNGSFLRYAFVRSFPIAINSMPVSYDTSQLLKVTVSMSYVRYIIDNLSNAGSSAAQALNLDFGDSPFTQAAFNAGNKAPTRRNVPGSYRDGGRAAFNQLSRRDATGAIVPGG